jgi:L-asparaginase
MTAPQVVVVGARGTIAGRSESRVSFHSYSSGALSIAEMVGSLQPEAGQVADVVTAEFGSDHKTLAGLHELSRFVDDRLRDADAAVVTCGTNELAETAYWLDLTIRSTKPVVVTGAMRPWTVIGSDGPPNLYNAILLAGSGRTAYFGTVVLFNDVILAARDAVKTDNLRLHTFQSPELGRLGAVDGPRIRVHRAPPRLQRRDGPRWHTPFDLSQIVPGRLPRVEIVQTYTAAGPEAITAFAEAGAEGIVLAGTPSREQKTVATSLLREGMVFVAAGNGATGAVYPDSEGMVISAGDLHPHKARLLLVLSLALISDPAEIAAWFACYGVPQVEVEVVNGIS